MAEAAKGTARRSKNKSIPPDALLEKKRATDRQSQRVVRDRTKKYISHLESLVEVLQTNQQDERLQLMTAQCNKLRDENEQLRDTILSITRAIQGVEKLGLVKTNFEEPQNTLAALTESSSIMPAYSRSSFSDGPSPMQPTPRPAYIPSPSDFTFNSVPSPPVQPSDREFTYPSPENEDKHVFVVLSNLLRQAETSSILSIDLDKDDDIVIRAVNHGWPQVEEVCQLDPAWQILRRIDQDFMFCWGSVERMATLRTTRLKLLQVLHPSTHKIVRRLIFEKQRMKSNEEKVSAHLPQYMHNRTTQPSTPSYLKMIDYFVWPELREYLLQKSKASPASIDLSNKTAAAFATCVRFLWPYELSNTWVRNTETGVYAFSKLFEEKMDDLSSWVMSTEFFESYPDLIGYIPSHDPNAGNFVSQNAHVAGLGAS